MGRRQYTRGVVKRMDDKLGLEKASLLSGRWYIIMSPSDEEGFNLTAYDTTPEDEDEDYIPAGAVVQQGIIELLESDIERVLDAGMARIAAHELIEQVVEEAEAEHKATVIGRDDNIVKVKFGREQ
jgi:hypothetical protein